MFCTYCGASLKKNAKFCTACGRESQTKGDVEQAFSESAEFCSRPVYGIPAYAHQPMPQKIKKELVIGLCMAAGLLLIGGVVLLILLLK